MPRFYKYPPCQNTPLAATGGHLSKLGLLDRELFYGCQQGAKDSAKQEEYNVQCFSQTSYCARPGNIGNYQGLSTS
jgi:hypothetical protein